ncbi:MAG: Npt1/Npt2 family nucleotide transporter [Rickettsia endosymbiont of Ixodes persulcatus]|nr:Npt1/Npt2 family nucleotide transporter [Rickettsia endosymbiont of Ixodes persulcatus]
MGSCFGDFNLLYAAIIVGTIQNILSKSSKYSLFDSTKEMAYIPLSLELRTKGKAAVEVIGTKFGKSLGAFIQSLIFIIIPTATFDSIIIYLLVIFIVMMSLWIWNVMKLNKEYNCVNENVIARKLRE